MAGLIFSLGMICGLVFVFLIVFLWAAVAGPIQEWLCEMLLDPLHNVRNPPVEDPVVERFGNPEELTVLISDVHLDTWLEGSSKPEAFADFLVYVKQQKIKEVYINGDLLDIPPHPLNQRDIRTLAVDYTEAQHYTDLKPGQPLGVLLSEYDATFVAINKLGVAPITMVTYLTGNHDIGVEGMRYIRPDLAWSAIRVAWNPAAMLKYTPDRWVYVEHGHRYDPFLWLYLRYAIFELFRSPGDPSLAQRGGKLGMGSNANFLRAPMAVQFFGWEKLDKRGRPAPGSLPLKESIPTKFAKYRFRQAARRVFRRYWWKGFRDVKVVTFGHTHIPDRYEFPYGHLYVNSGDWAGNENHQCYLLLHPNGNVTGPYQWRDPASAAF